MFFFQDPLFFFSVFHFLIVPFLIDAKRETVQVGDTAGQASFLFKEFRIAAAGNLFCVFP